MNLRKKLLLGINTAALVFLVGLSQPGLVLAASGSPTQGTNGSNPGTQSPTGADAGTFTYDSTTGLWTNAYYTWDPVTRTETPITPVVYTYNSTTNMWDSNQWIYNAAKGQYVSTVVSVTQPPAGAQTVGGPVTVSPDSSSSTDPNSGSSNDPSVSVNGNNNSNVNDSSSLTANNGLDSTAQTGNASVSSNTLGGNATSGDASAMATVLNMLQSSSSLSGLQASTFTDNITGNVAGDIVINPSSVQPSTPQQVASDTNLETNTSNNDTINNNLNLNANSGNSNVNSNTSAGNATSGNADAMANVINMIDSMISANQSFIGTINIYGNLDGNILMPQSFLNNLLASNAPTTTINSDQVNNLNSVINNNEAINNNVDTSATTGAANVTDNTQAGNATTGSASTKVTIFNLTGDQIVGQNTLLVFVNVMGTWVGLLMNAPAGATAAAYGGGITQDTSANNNVNSVVNNNQAINNNINVNSGTGNATVADNTSAGNATSGNAESGVNLLNMENSQFNLSGWFGVLFINVFGNWNGSFGANTPTPAGESDFAIAAAGGANSGTGGNTHKPLLGFVPSSDSQLFAGLNTTSPNSQLSLVSSLTKGNDAAAVSKSVANEEKNTMTHDHFVNEVIVGVAVVVGLSMLFSERLIASRRPKV